MASELEQEVETLRIFSNASLRLAERYRKALKDVAWMAQGEPCREQLQNIAGYVQAVLDEDASASTRGVHD